jgi:hypothetical protein
MQKTITLNALLSCLGAALLAGLPAQAAYQTYEFPFSFAFGMDTNQDDGSGLLKTPSGDPFSLLWDHLQLGAGHASAMAVAGNYEPGHRFGVRATVRPQQFTPDKPNDRVGLAVLGGPHDPPGSAFNTTNGQFYGLVWGPSVDATRSVIEIREGFDGAVLVQEDWGGVHPTADDAWAGLWQIYHLQGIGTYDSAGALHLTFTLTDHQGHSQSVSATIAEPREGNLFGFGGRLSSDGNPAFGFLNFSASGSLMLAERFVDGERLVQDLPRTSAWLGATGAGNLYPLSQPADGIITLDTSTSAHLLSYFTDGGPVTLGVGETLRVAFGFRIEGATDTAIGVRAGVMDSSAGARATEDGHNTGHITFRPYTGYGCFFNPNGGGTSSLRLRKRIPGGTNSSLLSVASVWSTIRSGGGTTVIIGGEDYSGEFLINRETDSVIITFSLFGDNIDPGATVSFTDTAEDRTFAFDSFGIWVNQNASDSLSLTSVDVEVLPPEPIPEGATFAAWQAVHFPGVTDPAIIGPDANPAGDGIRNFLKYAFNLDPAVAVVPASFLQQEVVGGKLRLTYVERTDAIDIEYVPQASLDLAGWGEGPESVVEVGRGPIAGEDLESVTIEAALAGDPAKAFLRVEIREK